MPTLLVPGQRESVDLFAAMSRGGPAAAPGAGPATTLLDSVKVVHAFSLTQVSRDRAERLVPIDTQDDDVMEIELEGGFTVWTSVARYREQLARYRPDAVTDAGIRFDVLPQPSVAERGVRDWVARALRLLRLEPDDISLEFASRGGERLAAWAATKLLMARRPAPSAHRRSADRARRAAGDADPRLHPRHGVQHPGQLRGVRRAGGASPVAGAAKPLR